MRLDRGEEMEVSREGPWGVSSCIRGCLETCIVVDRGIRKLEDRSGAGLLKNIEIYSFREFYIF